MGLLDAFFVIFMLSVVGFSMFTAVSDPRVDPGALLNQTIENPLATAGKIFVYSQGLSITTPSIRFKWIPFTDKDKYVYLLEDIPLLDTTDLLPLVLVTLVALMIMNWLPIFKDGFKGLMLKVLILIIIWMITWGVWKLFWYLAYVWSANSMGIDPHIAISARNKTINEFKDVLMPIFLSTCFMFAVGVKVVVDKIKGE